MDWKEIIWTEARQVTVFLDWPRMPGDDAAPAQFFVELRRAGREVDATKFLALALPRLSAVRWLRAVMKRQLPDANTPLLASVDAWLRAPSDALRREVLEAAHALSPEEAGTNEGATMLLCASAIFFSGGSLAPSNQPASPASKQATGQFVAAGILLCTSDAEDPDVALDQALGDGVTFATHSMETV
ncbi:DUF6931 family protein [Sphingomonas sp. ASY06-1R]|uniref:DUF6931 family protein n=1 Tax=Sphingomonas sp. ASY06-1R TaxID=3445771 RepID=UPI003FA227F4